MRRLFKDIRESKVISVTSPMFFSVGYSLVMAIHNGAPFYWFLLGVTGATYVLMSCHVVVNHKAHIERMDEMHEEHLVNMERLEHLHASMSRIRGQDELGDFDEPVFH